jgi:NAD+ diphosphatase
MPILTFDDPHFDRAALNRRDPDWWHRARRAEDTRLIPVIAGKVLITGEGAGRRLVDVPARRVPLTSDGAILLGQIDGVAWIAAAFDHTDAVFGLAEGAEPADLRTAGLTLPADQAGLAAYAKALTWFHAQHRHCGVCGKPTMASEAGHARTCQDPECATTVYPRSDPAVICLVHDGGDRCILGRAPRFPDGMFSTLAGFVEAGESLETCLKREIKEEVGVDLADITYLTSQPWPLPQSLMTGFHARATSEAITLDEEEIAEARWFTRAEVHAAIRGEADFTVPPPISIARWLIERWLAGDEATT